MHGFRSLSLTWQVGPCADRESEPERLVPAAVPGAVQLDWSAAEGLPDYAVGTNSREWEWMSERHWCYRTRFQAPELDSDQRLHLVCLGVDYACLIRCNGVELLRQEGMFTPIDLDLSDHLVAGDNLLEIRIEPAPGLDGGPPTKRQARTSCKPAVAYGWDWHPRLIPLGIWDETRLEIRPRGHLAGWDVDWRLDGDGAELALRVATTEAGTRIRWRVHDPDGRLIHDQVLAPPTTLEATTCRIAMARRWWPRGHGEQARYAVELALLGEDDAVLATETRRIGLCEVALSPHPETWNEPRDFPKSRSEPPITLTVNDRPLFAKGSNWVPPDIFPGRIDEAMYRPLIERAVAANFNCLRVWGGGIVNKDVFYELCDEAGLLVFVEFPLACNPYPDDERYLAVLGREARMIVSRYRHHPSIALWCGGNELFNGWSQMTDQSHPLRLLNAVCYELDRRRPFLPTFPVMGMGHGPYLFRDHQSGEEVFATLNRSRNTAYSEFGCPGPAPVELLREIIPADQLFPPKPGGAWEHHHAFGAWGPSEAWLCLEIQRHYFGEPGDLETMVERGQLLQAIGYRHIFEEARRQWPRCSMACNWCFNEPWPCAANNSLIAHGDRPKAAYEAVAAACRPALASARCPRFSWRAGEVFEAECVLLNDAPEPVPGATVHAELQLGAERLALGSWTFPEVAPQTNTVGPVWRCTLPRTDAGPLMHLHLRVEGRSELDSSYVLHYRSGDRRGTGLRELNQ